MSGAGAECASWREDMSDLREQYVVDAKGKKTGVILSLRLYQQLLEDLHDLAVVAERRHEATIRFEDIKNSSQSPVISSQTGSGD